MSGAGVVNKDLYSQRHHRTASMSQNQNMLNQMNDCLKECQRVPTLRRKVQETLGSLEQSMLDYRAQRGVEASIVARRRLRDKASREEESKDKSVQIMLEQTAVLDSPIRAANL